MITTMSYGAELQAFGTEQNRLSARRDISRGRASNGPDIRLSSYRYQILSHGILAESTAEFAELACSSQ